MRVKLAILPVFLFLWFIIPRCGHAVEGRIPISGQYTISVSGRYILTNSITATTGNAITIAVSDVDLDLGGFTIFAATGFDGIYGLGYKNIAIYNGSIDGGANGIRLYSATDEGRYVIRNVRIRNPARGMYLYSSAANKPVEFMVESNIVVQETTTANTEGILVTNSRGSVIRDNTLTGFTQWGIAVTSCTNCSIEDNRVNIGSPTPAYPGIALWSSDTNIIRNNIVRGALDGIALTDSNANMIAYNNSSYNAPTGNGIHLKGASLYNTIDGNLAAGHSGAGGCGIRFDATATGNVYSNNRTLNNTTGVCDAGSNTNLGNVWWTRGNTGTDPSTDFLGTTDSQPLVLKTANAERVRVDAAGNVGIGTASPGRKLEVSGDAQVTGAFYDSSGDAGSLGQILQSTGAQTNWINQSAIDDGDWTISGLNMYSAVSGNVGIGTSTPQNKLDVEGAVAVGANYSGSSTAPANGLIVEGNVGIGTTGPSAKLDVRVDSNNYALMGYTAAVLANNNHYESPGNGDGQAAFKALRDRSSQNDGTGYGYGYTNQAIAAYNYWGDTYTFAITGHSWLDFGRSGAVLGAEANGGSPWGALSYRSSGSVNYGGYFTSTFTGTGLLDTAEGIGLGSYGRLLGGWIRGEEYGLFSSGKRFGMFTDGNTFSTGYHAFVKENAGEKTVAYSVASPSVDVIFHGKARLEPGQSSVAFPPELLKMLSPQSPVGVFLSPIGSDAGLSLSAVTPQGFDVAHAGSASSGLEFYWIAIGNRAGFEDVETPEEILRPDFEVNMQQVAFDDNDLNGSGLGMYFDGALRFGIPPKSQTRADRMAEGAIQTSAPAGNAPPAIAESKSEAEYPLVTSPETDPSVPAPPAGTGTVSFPVATAVKAGDVLVMIPNNGGALHPCVGAADPMVAGIAVTDEQGGLASVTGAGYAMVNADATLHPIARGDLLVTSPIPGHAMKGVNPMMGTIIGKAMADLGTGTTPIKVLVMLR